LKEGVVIFSTDAFERDVLIPSGVISETPLNIFWDENSDNFLTGSIQVSK
jgi:hypothetical protein